MIAGRPASHGAGPRHGVPSDERALKIDKKIVKYRVVKPGRQGRGRAPKAKEPVADAQERRTSSGCTRSSSVPRILIGSTYKIKTPVSDHAMYVTINDIVLNEGTEHEQRRPFEIFINSKNLDHYQWIVALTRIISAVFRKGGDVTFLVEELKAVFDPRGGYWQAGGKFMPSIIAELGYVIEKHLQKIGLLRSPEMDEHRAEADRAEARGVRERGNKQQDAFCEESLSAGRAAVLQVQHGCGRHDGRLHDVPELRRLEVRMRCAHTHKVTFQRQKLRLQTA